MKSYAAKLAKQDAAGTGLLIQHLNAKLKKQSHQVRGLDYDYEACLYMFNNLISVDCHWLCAFVSTADSFWWITVSI